MALMAIFISPLKLAIRYNHILKAYQHDGFDQYMYDGSEDYNPNDSYNNVSKKGSQIKSHLHMSSQKH